MAEHKSDAQILDEVRSRKARIAVLGMGHVGLPTALGLASMGWTVLGADASPELIAQLQSGKIPFFEPGLDDLFREHLGKRFIPAADLETAIREATILFLCVGTPQKASGEADLSQVETAARTIAQNLNGYKLIVEKSTVPAITAQWIKRTISRYATHAGGLPEEMFAFDVASIPEFLQEGVALKNIAHPYRVVCGVETDRARKMLKFYTDQCARHCS